MTTTARVDARAGLVDLLQDFMAANPTMLLSVHRARPEGFTGDYPIGFVDSLSESAGHSMSVRRRILVATMAIVGEYRLNGEHVDQFDAIVDAFMDYCTARPHISTNTGWERLTVEDYEETIGDQLRPAVRVTIQDFTIQEGRTP